MMTASDLAAERDARQLDRLTFFCDAVFAIAMTLLVVEVRLPRLPLADDRALGQALLGLIPNYVGFLLSFLVLARFWTGHHALMALLARASPRLTWANLGLLLGVAFLPFPTAVVSEYGGLRAGVACYSGWLVLVGLLNRWLVRVAADPGLLAPDVSPAALAPFRRRCWIPILVGVAGLAVGLVAPLAGVAALVVSGPVLGRLLGRRPAPAPAPATPG